MSIAQIWFWISGFYALYVIALYPLLLQLLARLRPAGVKRSPYAPTVSLVMATHNGAAFLPEKIRSIFNLDYPAELLQIIVVDDGSDDGSREILNAYKSKFITVSLPKSGKSAALNYGIERATGEILVLTDVRQRLARESLRYLLENFADPKVGCVSAELQIQSGDTTAEESIGAYWRYERWIRLNLSAIDSIFGASGSYYAVRRALATPIPAGMLLDDMFLPLHAFFLHYRLIVDARAKMFDYSTSLGTEFGRKVRTLAGNYQILRSYPGLLGPQNRLWFHFVSYKFGRLLLPFALLIAAIASLIAGGTLAMVSLALQLTVVAIVLLDPKIPERTFVKRLSAPIRAFVVMMLATACAVSIWFVPPEKLWRTTRVIRRDIAA